MDISDIPTSGTPEKALARLVWLEGLDRDEDAVLEPAVFDLCRRLFGCWPEGRHIPHFAPSNEIGGPCMNIDDDERAAGIRVYATGVALAEWSWDTDEETEEFAATDEDSLRAVLPRWLDVLQTAQSYKDWEAKSQNGEA